MYLVLIRHGETDWNVEGRMQGRMDPPLNTRGIQQARRLVTRLTAEERIDKIYTSPLARAQMTAGIIGKELGVVPIPDERLVERSVGHLEGLTLAEIQRQYPDVYRAWHQDHDRVILPGAEGQEQLRTRVADFLEMVRTRHPDERIAVVTHGGTLGMFFAILMGLDIEKRFPFRFDNTSVSKVDLSRRRPRIDLLNDTCHLRESFPVEPSIACPPIQAEMAPLPTGVSIEME